MLKLIVIRVGGKVDDPKARVKKQADTVAWNSLGQDDWTVDFGNDSPLNEGLRIYVPRNGPSEQCTIKDDAKEWPYEYWYEVLPDKHSSPEAGPRAAGPVIIVDAGNGNTPHDKGPKPVSGKGKRKASRKTSRTTAKKAAGRKPAARKSARNTVARKSGRKTAARKTKGAASRKRAAKKR